MTDGNGVNRGAQAVPNDSDVNKDLQLVVSFGEVLVRLFNRCQNGMAT